MNVHESVVGCDVTGPTCGCRLLNKRVNHSLFATLASRVFRGCCGGYGLRVDGRTKGFADGYLNSEVWSFFPILRLLDEALQAFAEPLDETAQEPGAEAD